MYLRSFRRKMAVDQSPNTIPVTLDIGGMYTNVPLEEGLKSFEEAMNKREDLTTATDFLVNLMRFVSTSNIFVFDRKLFLQLLSHILKLFTSHLNSLHPTIKFEVKPGESYNFTTRSINFLDLTIWIDEAGYIQTSIASLAGSFLTSFHPPLTPPMSHSALPTA